jgi:hypothetical protein
MNWSSPKRDREPHNDVVTQVRDIVTDADVDESLDFLRDVAEVLGDQKGNMIRNEELRRRVRSQVANQYKRLGLEAAARIAEASDQYRRAIEDQVESAAAYEVSRAKQKFHEIRIEVWRTIQATRRAARV